MTIWPFNRKPRRKGIIQFSGEGVGLFNKGQRVNALVEVVELEDLGDYSRVHITSVSGGPFDAVSKAIGEIVHKQEVKWIEQPGEPK